MSNNKLAPKCVVKLNVRLGVRLPKTKNILSQHSLKTQKNKS